MDGGGGRKAANHMFRNARADGLTIGAMSSSVVSLNIMRESGVIYDIESLFISARPKASATKPSTPAKNSGLSNLEKLRAKPGLRIGAQSVGHVSYIAGRFFAYLLDFKEPKFIAGYTAPEVDAALLPRRARCAGECRRLGVAAQSGLAGKRRDGLSRDHGSSQGRQASSAWPPSGDRAAL